MVYSTKAGSEWPGGVCGWVCGWIGVEEVDYVRYVGGRWCVFVGYIQYSHGIHTFGWYKSLHPVCFVICLFPFPPSCSLISSSLCTASSFFLLLASSFIPVWCFQKKNVATSLTPSPTPSFHNTTCERTGPTRGATSARRNTSKANTVRLLPEEKKYTYTTFARRQPSHQAGSRNICVTRTEG
jgi:hypothetical protein